MAGGMCGTVERYSQINRSISLTVGQHCAPGSATPGECACGMNTISPQPGANRVGGKWDCFSPPTGKLPGSNQIGRKTLPAATPVLICAQPLLCASRSSLRGC